MKRYFSLILFSITLNTTLFAQRIECIAAVNYNHFYTKIGSNTDPNTTEDYKNGYGYTFSIGIDDIKIDDLPLKFTLKYDHYTGGVSYNSSSMGGGNAYNIHTQKDMLGLGIYPLNATFFHKLKLSIGTEFNFLIHSQQSGNQSSWYYTPNGPNPSTSSSSTIDNNSKKVNQIFNFGINTSLRYEFPLSDSWLVAPQAMLYLSMTNEFNSSFNNTKSIRPYLGLAFIKNLKGSN
ncbi:hypothetical protein [Cytophaga aurantiaca]|uniref:hypothetical protein n=1 Tax=Cytophaga aurantiaca TaxID=29530 RepID=UPI0003710633|nr:hypothetical protein [Cytophaga aurantiaca]